MIYKKKKIATIATMNDFPVIGYPCFAHRIVGSPGGKHCESLQRNVWRGVVKSSVFGHRMPHFAVILLEKKFVINPSHFVIKKLSQFVITVHRTL